MKKVILLTLLVLSHISYGQRLIPFGGSLITDTAYDKGHLRVNGVLRLPFYGTSDPTKALTIDPNGLVVLRSITGLNNNMATNNLTATGNRYHNWANFNLRIDSLHNFSLGDQYGVKFMTVNDVSTRIIIGDSVLNKGLVVNYNTGTVFNYKGDIEIGTGIGLNKLVLDSNNATLKNNLGTILAALDASSGNGLLKLKDLGSGYYTSYYTGTLTANRSLISPDHSGTTATNDGVTNYNSGALVAQAAIIVTHGLSFTPSRIFIMPKNSFTGAALRDCWIDGIGTTIFRINFGAFVTGTLIFDWQAF